MTQQSSAGWLKAFISRRSLVAPDGRPLFRYRVTPDEFAELQEHFTPRFPRTDKDYAAFCLYAAEWWRRHGKGFKWDGLLESIGLANAYTELYDPIEVGLRYWKRKLRVVRATTGIDRAWRDFVGTLSREGGLPLQLLHGDQSSVKRFFKHLLKDRYASGALSAESAEAAAHYLPEAWRHPDIYELGAQLVTKVWELRETVTHADDPVGELARVSPRWKEQLPIVLDTSVAEVLVQGLVKEAHEIAVRNQPVLTVETTLTRRGEGWSLERRLDLPRKLRPKQICRLLGFAEEHELPRRLRLVITAGSTPVPVAMLTQWSAGERYDVEFLAALPVRLPALEDIHLHAETRDELLGGGMLRGGEALSEAPWIFTPSAGGEDDDDWTLTAQSSCSVRSATALVAIPTDATASSTNASSPVGRLALSHGVRALRIHNEGTLRIQQNDETFEVSVSAPADETWSYQLDGQKLDALGPTDVWRGLPRLIAESQSGLRRHYGPEKLEWRPRGVQAAWRKMSPECLGLVDLRYAPGGVTQTVRKAKIVPAETALELVRHDGADLGGLRILHSQATRANILADEGFLVEPDECNDGFEWTFVTGDAPPASIEVDLIWPQSSRLRIRVPYPVAGARFIDHEGRPLGSKATISLEHLARCQLEAVLPASEPDPVVSVRLADACDRTPGFVAQSETSRRLRECSRGARSPLKRYSLGLHEIADDVRLRMASSAEMNAHVSLELGSPAAGHARLRVRRFPVSMRVNETRDAAVVLWEKSETHIEEVVKTMEVRRVPVVEPDAPPVVLEPLALGEFPFNWKGDSATQLIAGFRDGACCARPIIWAPPVAEVSRGQDGEPQIVEAVQATTISAAVEIVNAEQRSRAMVTLLRRMAMDPAHPEWARTLPYINTLGSLPSTTFDLLDAMAEVPASCVFAVLAGQSENRTFETLWTALEDLSFSWETVPVRAWIRGAEIWWQQARSSVEHIDEHVASIVEESLIHTYNNSSQQIRLRMPAFQLAAELIDAKIFDQASAANSMVGLTSQNLGRHVMLEERERALQELLRAQANVEKWPVMDMIRGLRNYLDTELPRYLIELTQLSSVVNRWQLSVVMAPILAALASAWDVPLQPEQIFAVRQLRAFDINWFQSCHQYTLACAVGLILEKTPEQYR